MLIEKSPSSPLSKPNIAFKGTVEWEVKDKEQFAQDCKTALKRNIFLESKELKNNPKKSGRIFYVPIFSILQDSLKNIMTKEPSKNVLKIKVNDDKKIEMFYEGPNLKRPDISIRSFDNVLVLLDRIKQAGGLNYFIDDIKRTIENRKLPEDISKEVESEVEEFKKNI